MLLLCAALGLQCSDDNGGVTDEISGNPQPEKNNAPKAPSFDDPSKIFGYTDVTNARLIVTSVDSVVVDPEYAYIADWIQGLGDTSWGISNTTKVFFDYDSNSFKVTFPENASYSLLSASDNGGTLWLPQWDLKYEWDESGGLTISGKGRGSHVPDAIFLYLEQFEAFLASEVLFEFSGVLDRRNEMKGTFSIIEKSPENSFNLEIYGTLAILNDDTY